jgi:hypothetical protein
MEQAERAEYVSFATVKQMFEQTYICVQIARKSFPKFFSDVTWEPREMNGKIPESVQNILTSMRSAHEWALRWNKNNAVYAFHRHKGETLQLLPVYCKLLTSQLYQRMQTYNTTLAISKTQQASLPAQAVQETHVPRRLVENQSNDLRASLQETHAPRRPHIMDKACNNVYHRGSITADVLNHEFDRLVSRDLLKGNGKHIRLYHRDRQVVVHLGRREIL